MPSDTYRRRRDFAEPGFGLTWREAQVYFDLEAESEDCRDGQRDDETCKQATTDSEDSHQPS